MHKEFGELLDIELMFRNDAAVGRACHRRQHGCKTGVAAEDFQNHETLVRAGGSSQRIGHLNGAGDAGAEADAVISAGYVVVHGLGDSDNPYTFLIQAHAVAERVITADRNHVFDAEPGEILENRGREIVLLRVVLGFQMVRDAVLADAPRIGARRVKKRAAGAAGPIDHVFGEALKVVRIVVFFVANNIDQSRPAAPYADHFIPFAERAEGDRANGGVQPGNVTATCQNANYALLYIDVSHDARLALTWSNKQMIMRLRAKIRKCRNHKSKIACPSIKSPGLNRSRGRMDYWWRSATMGSTREARRAGR